MYLNQFVFHLDENYIKKLQARYNHPKFVVIKQITILFCFKSEINYTFENGGVIILFIN